VKVRSSASGARNHSGPVSSLMRRKASW
jgi:hypothetical protein